MTWRCFRSLPVDVLPFLDIINQLEFQTMNMNTNLIWAGGAAFIGASENGQKIVIDGPPEGGGRDLGPRPMETLLLGMGACTAYDVLSILKKSRGEISDCKIEISSKRAGDHPKVFLVFISLLPGPISRRRN